MSTTDKHVSKWAGNLRGCKSSLRRCKQDFWHAACVWCKRLDPELSEVAKEFSGKLKFAR